MIDNSYVLSQFERRLANLIRDGRVAKYQAKPPRVKVEYDVDDDDKPVLSDWLIYFEARAGVKITWDPPKIGEQCLIFSPSGDLRNGYALLGLNTAENAPVSENPMEHVIKYDDGTTFVYNRETHEATWNIPNGSMNLITPTFNIKAKIVHEGDYEQTGNFKTSGTIDAAKNITSKMELFDKTGSMSTVRVQYNGHKHGDSPTPDTPMS
ncbi:MAG: phage baseplate assembly protein V [Vibrio sp.]